MLQDIAVLTGGQLISEEVGLSLDAVSLDMMGSLVVTIDKESTIVAGGETKADVQKRIGQIRSQLEDTDSDYDQEKTSRADRQTRGLR